MQIPVGTVFGKLTVLNEIDRSGQNRRFRCLCECGKEAVKFLNGLRSGRATSCGCSYDRLAGHRAALAAIARTRLARALESDLGRICLICNEWKSWDLFYNDPKRPHGKGSNCTECIRWRAIKRIYGISRGEWEALKDAQGGGCALCGDTDGLVVDHDHSCCKVTDTSERRGGCQNCIRGLLCDFCNRILGRIEQKPALASRFTDYLRRRPLAKY